MNRYTEQGTGDMCREDEPEDTRPVCGHCNEHHDGSYHNDKFCTPRCAILGDIGGFKRHILKLIDRGMSFEHVIYQMTFYDWFEGVSESSTERWLRAIWLRIENDLSIMRQAAEIENYYQNG